MNRSANPPALPETPNGAGCGPDSRGLPGEPAAWSQAPGAATSAAGTTVSTTTPAGASLAAAAIFAALAYAEVVRLPATAPWPRSDAMVMLSAALRMARGEIIYRDFFELTFPGAQFWYAALMRWLGATAWIPALTLVALGTGSAWLAWHIARRLCGGRAAWLAGLAVVAAPLFVTPDPTHRWFSATAALAATLLALQETRWSHAAAGALCGLAAFFTQSAGPLVAAAIGAWLLWRGRAQAGGWRRAIEAGACFAGTLTALLWWFVWKAGPRIFWDSTVRFVLRNYGTVWWNSWRVYLHALPPHHSLGSAPLLAAFALVHAAVPLVYLVFLARFAQAERRSELAAPLLVALVGLAEFAAIVTAPSEHRISVASAPALVLLVWLLYQPGKVERVGRAALWGLIALLAIAAPVVRQREWRTVMRLPIGRVALSSASMIESLSWLRTRTHPGEYCFGHPPLEFALQLRPAAPVPFANGGNYTPPEQVRAIVSALETRRVPLLLMMPVAYMPVEGGANLRPLREYMAAHYRITTIVGGVEVWERK